MARPGRRGPWAAFALVLLAVSAVHAHGHDDEDGDSTSALGACYASDRNFACMLQVCRRIAFHWTIGPASAAPGENCSYADASNTGGTALNVSALNGVYDGQYLHAALVTDVTGYVAMAWPEKGGEMVPADAIAGFMADDGSADVQAYYLKGFTEAANQPDPSVPITNKAVMTTSNGGLVTCFSRPLTAIGAAVIKLELDGQPLNFAAGTERRMSDHITHCDVKVSLSATLAAIGTPVTVGGNLVADFDSESEELGAKAAHGWLMMLAWALLIPLGMLVPRHRALVGSLRPLRAVGPEKAWFVAHMSLQWTAIALFFIGMIIIVAQEGVEVSRWRGLYQAHGGLGFTVFSLLIVHLIVAVFRPHPGAPNRALWEGAHRWTARLLILFALINLLIGPRLYGWSGGSVAGFYVAFCLFLAAVAGIAVWARFASRNTEVPKDEPLNTLPVSTHVPLADM